VLDYSYVPQLHADMASTSSYKVTKGLLDRFGPRRVIDTPITESGFCGLAVGAALAGLHPVVSKNLLSRKCCGLRM
jgi:pyruvate/2-oxoglutarate/acetoin dehydrogenase E1 component